MEQPREERVTTEPSPTEPEAATDATTVEATPNSPGIFAQEYSAEEGGKPTEIYCPACGEEINGSYLPMFRCPHCAILIFRDENGNVTNHEQKHTCPECGHTFGEMSDEAPTEFRRMCRNLEQKTEGVMLQLDRFVTRLLA